jgi:hypothetical protein
MNLSEITLTHTLKTGDRNDWHHVPNLERILKHHGWHMLGTGAEAAVAEHPQKSYVLKIFNSDSRYTQFVEFVQSHSSNPHVPKFSRYVRQVPGTKFSYVRMEKLAQVTAKQLLTKYANHVLDMIIMGHEHRIRMVVGQLRDEFMSILDTWGYGPDSLLDPETQMEIYAHMGGSPPITWTHILDDLAEFSQSSGIGTWDMHAANFMRRGETLVIVDPFY